MFILMMVISGGFKILDKEAQLKNERPAFVSPQNFFKSGLGSVVSGAKRTSLWFP